MIVNRNSSPIHYFINGPKANFSTITSLKMIYIWSKSCLIQLVNEIPLDQRCEIHECDTLNPLVLNWYKYRWTPLRIMLQGIQVCLKHTPPASKFFSISFYNTVLYIDFGKFLLNIETIIYVFIDALRNISPSELKYVLFHIWC